MRVSRYFATAAVSALLSAAPALADVTPRQVWDDYSAYIEGFGYAITATEAETGDALTLTDVTMTYEIPDDAGQVTLVADEIALTDQGDGTVSVTFSERIPMSVTSSPEYGEEVDLVADLRLLGADIIVSGDPNAMTYQFSANSAAMQLTKLVVDGEELSGDDLRAEILFGQMTGTADVTLADGKRTSVQQTSIAEMSYDVAFTDPEDADTKGSLSGRLEAIESDGQVVFPLGSDMTDMATFLADGMAASGDLTFGKGQSQFSVTEVSASTGESQTTQGESSSESGRISVSMSSDEIAYDVSAKSVNYSMMGGEIPFPISMGMEELGLKIGLPASKSDTPQDMSLGLTLAGLTVSDMIWSLFDPGAVLPRDPATVMIDLTGKVTPFVDLFDAEAMANMEMNETVPGELNALTLNGLTVELAGAKLTGVGDFTFDNTDTQTFGGMPKPTGAVELQASGVNGLIDKLIQMGLVSDQDAMGARMMMSMFGVPGSEPDSLSSKIEINEQGHVLANGQRIQ